MDELVPKAKWTVTQPWRGLFGTAITLWVAFVIATAFDLQSFLGNFTLFLMSFVAIEVVIGLGWGGKFPSVEGWPQPWPGLFLSGFVIVVATLAYLTVNGFLGGGAAHPATNVLSICTVITTFFLVIAFGMWPFQKGSLPTKGLLTWLLAYVITYIIWHLFNFSLLSYPAGVSPSPIAAVPFYAAGGPLAALAAWAPTGPFAWESIFSFYFWALLFLFVFVHLGMWPFYKAPSLMKQPVMGIVVTITCLILSAIAYVISVQVLSIEPLKHLLNGICYLFGALFFLVMLQTWPGRTLSQPAGGFLNVVLSIGIAIIGFYAMQAFCQWHFGKAFAYPVNIFAMGNMMLGLTFPAWAAYGAFFDFWPLPPTPPPPGS
jgi:hypothetical protein